MADPRSPTAPAPSPVLFLRGCPMDVDVDRDLGPLLTPFGAVVASHAVPHRGQVFVQFQQLSSATNALTYYQGTPAVVRGCHVRMAYSTRAEVGASTAPPPAPARVGGSDAVPAGASATAPGPIVLASVLCYTYPMTAELLHGVFSPCGTVLRIVTFFRNSQLRILVEFADSAEAQRALIARQGVFVFPGCNQLSLQPSTLPSLTVREDSPSARDFTRSPLTDGSLLPAPDAVGGGVSDTPVALVTGFPRDTVDEGLLFGLCGTCGDVVRVNILSREGGSGERPGGSALVEFADALQCQRAVQMLGGISLLGSTWRLVPSRYTSVSGPGLRDYAHSAAHRFSKGAHSARNHLNVVAPSRKLHVANLPTDGSVGEEELRVAFGRFGAVEAVQMLGGGAPGKGMALVTMGSLDEAVLALAALHNSAMGRRFLRISFARPARAHEPVASQR